MLAHYNTKAMELRTRHKGKMLCAAVAKTGLIRFDGESFTSPHAIKRQTPDL